MDPDNEKVRKTLFPHLTPEQYADLVARKQAEFGDLPPERQDRPMVDKMGADLDATKRRSAQRLAKNVIETAQRKARGSKY